MICDVNIQLTSFCKMHQNAPAPSHPQNNTTADKGNSKDPL